MFGMGAQELMVILVIVLVLFGGSKLPDLAKSLGKSMKEFKKGIATEDEEQAAKPAASVSASPAPQRYAAPARARLEAARTTARGWARRHRRRRPPDADPKARRSV
jgi:sec-independent protein translocase protein TatA